ncbi:immunity protein Tsi6 family protein [Pseudomonas sp. NPDC089996]|uniref:immunity protein Tsi6 family protein n=1 Tax=Pseudomonas sp. NPDC089996 TaxID=3364474 RepID=UPI003822E9B3
MQPTTPLEYVDKALVLTVDRQNRAPGFPVYATVIHQLEYIRAVFEGSEKDKSKLHRLTIGALASKEFESTDEALAEALSHVYYIAEQSANGLKIRLPGEK